MIRDIKHFDEEDLLNYLKDFDENTPIIITINSKTIDLSSNFKNKNIIDLQSLAELIADVGDYMAKKIAIDSGYRGDGPQCIGKWNNRKRYGT